VKMIQEKSTAPRILLVIGGMYCGGAQRVIADMANYWAAKGWHVSLTTWSGPDVPDFYQLAPNISRVWLYVPRGGRLPFATLRTSVARISRLRRLLRTARPDCVISFIDVSNIHTILASLGLGLRVVVSERTNPAINHTLSRPWRVLRRICYSWADQIVAQTRDAAAWVEHNCHARVAVIPNSLRVLPDTACRREPIVVALGRLTAEKGIDILLHAFARIRNEFSDWRLCVIGDGPERNALESLGAKLELRERLCFLGEVASAEDWLARSGLMVHASRREGFPNAVLEAMGTGAAGICADCPSGPSELIEEGVNGRLVPIGDVDRLARVMAELMANPGVREELGRQARAVRHRYSPEIIMAQWEEACVLQGSR